MKKQYKKYLYILVFVQVLICLVVSSILIILSKKISAHNNNILQAVAIKDTEKCMREMVDNMIMRINNKTLSANQETQKLIELIAKIISNYKDEEMLGQLQGIMNPIYSMEYGKSIKIILHNAQETLLFENAQMNNITGEFHTDSLMDNMLNCLYYKKVSLGSFDVYIFVEQKDIELIVKSYVYHEIHNSVFANNEYIWVNEILNYAGGDNYAIRRIHPNLKDTEGSYLSTNQEDMKGNLPYLSELDGINQNGEVIHTYYFKNKMDDNITPKISYAKLYEPFHWVIATGKPLDDIYGYTNELNAYGSHVVNQTLIFSLIAMLSIFIIGIVIIVRVHRKYRKNIDFYVKKETELDSLTGAYNRKVAQMMLTDRFKATDQSQSLSLLLMLDIDNFKRINDTFGHDVGDTVLKKVTQAIRSNISDSDYLFRWGGEEFVLFTSSVDYDHHRQFGEMILQCVNTIDFKSKEEQFQVSVSIGSSYFYSDDIDFTQALKRADIALFHSKKTGKNKYTSFEE